MDQADFNYDVALSFAGEQRDYVAQVAIDLRSRGVRVFYDDYETATLWGKDLYSHLDDIYRHQCRYCVIFVSKAYEKKVWTNQERRSAQARAIEEKQEYILPARFDDTPIPGMPDTIHYIDLNQTTPSTLCELIARKLGNGLRRNYFPPILDRLFAYLDIEEDSDAQGFAKHHAEAFFHVLRRMTPEERRAIICLIRFGCPGDLPKNVHIYTDLLSRHTGLPEAALERLLAGVRSLGFRCSVYDGNEDEGHAGERPLGDSHLFRLTWTDLSEVFVDEPEHSSALLVAKAMLLAATDGLCEACGSDALGRLDFSQLARATARDDPHSRQATALPESARSDMPPIEASCQTQNRDSMSELHS